VTIASALLWDRTVADIEVIWVGGEQICFCAGDSTENSPTGKSLAGKAAERRQNSWTSPGTIVQPETPPKIPPMK
jgi:hypothetical protein